MLQKIKRGCVKTLAQPFYMHKAQTFTSPGFVITQSSCMFRHKVFRYGKLHFRPYIPNQAVLFSGRIDEILTANDSVRIVNTVVDNLNLDNFKNLYKATGWCSYHPKMMRLMSLDVRGKLMEYDSHLDTLGEHNSYSKTTSDATFMCIKEGTMRNGQTKSGYNLQQDNGRETFVVIHNPHTLQIQLRFNCRKRKNRLILFFII